MEANAQLERDVEAVVVGAGPAGLSAAAELRRRGVEVLVLERAAEAGASWRTRYDGLRLNSSRSVSGVRGAPIPRRAGTFPSRDAYAEYLASCVGRLGLTVRFGVAVERIDRAGAGWVVRTSGGDFGARCVVVATGYDRVPRLPDWPGHDAFAGELRHAVEYRGPGPYAGRDVLVVGSGNSGTEIAAQLTAGGARTVRISMRTPGNVFPRKVLGVPMSVIGALSRRQPARVVDRGGRLIQRIAWGDLSRHGWPRAPMGVGTELRRKGLGPVVDGGFVDALRAGRVSVVAAVEGFEGADVVLADGARVRPDAVIAATGYAHGLEPLVGHLGVLAASGRPARIDGGATPDAPGLHFIGYWLPLGGQLYGMRIAARRIGREVARARRRAARRSGSGRRRSCGARTVAAS
jgi:cation diffusion facilitator CzcD-associated flavoprotein CzcO